MQIKVCGITTLDDALLCRDLGVHFIGLIRADSPRSVSLDQAVHIVEAVMQHLRPVLLFRDAPLESVISEIRTTGAGWVQLHGSESAAYVSALRAAIPAISIIRACEISQDSAPEERQAIFSRVFDTIRPDVVVLDRPKGAPADHHEDFRLLAANRPETATQLWCAGGLNPANLAAAIRSSRFDGVDVARGVESAPGKKDEHLLRQFLAIIRQIPTF